MKRIEIPMYQENSQKQNVDLTSINDLDDIHNDLQHIVKKLKNNLGLTRSELIYLYDIYNTRWLKNIHTKYDFTNGCWSSDFISTSYYPTGDWFYSKGELASIKYVNDIMEENYFRNLGIIFDCEEKQIARSERALLSDPNRYVILLDNLTKEGMYSNLKYIVGNIILPNAIDINLPSLEAVTYHVDFSSLRFADFLKNLRSIGGNAIFLNLLSAKGLSNLESIGGDAIFPKIGTTIGLNNLKVIGGNADFREVKIGNNFTSIRIIGGHANFSQLHDVDELKNISYIGELSKTPYLTLDGKETLRSKTRKLVKE